VLFSCPILGGDHINIFSRLFKSRAEPKNGLFNSTYSFFFGSTSSGKNVNERTAMQTVKAGCKMEKKAGRKMERMAGHRLKE
jgi:hypothetical protein